MQSDVDRLRKQIKELRADLAKLGVLARGAAGEKIHEAGESLQDSLHGYLDEGRECVEDCEERVTDMIRAKPFQSVLIALGVGFLLSIFMRRS